MTADQSSSAPGPDDDMLKLRRSMSVARPLSELPPKLLPRRIQPAAAENEYDVLHYMR
jgi:hypothetical protein